MSHGPAVQWEQDNASQIKAKVGVYLFVFYTLIYAIFIVINVASPKSMGIIVLFGLNLACVYGFGLIILAMVMGLIYNQFCTNAEYRMNKTRGEDK